MTNTHKGPNGANRLLWATRNSVNGLKAAYAGESAFRQEAWIAAVLLPVGAWLGRGWVEAGLLCGSVMLVLIVELLNSGIEAAIDRVSLEFHDLSKRAKDLASAAVLISLLLCGGIWCAALWQRFLA
jgi:diacylglycerol kinase (ATP)